ASQSTDWSAFAQTLSAMAALFLVQYLAARLRKASNTFETLLQNQPVVLMRDGVILHEALTSTRVAKDDLIAKLREANVLDLSQVRAAILETTGDVSVLHGHACSEELLQGTKRLDR
ncbi:MAG TPA: YetF domain-containing protein, partial [Polyangiales bacterium]|nr:YetF domain-containing protein [Polyangiales bacterium]